MRTYRTLLFGTLCFLQTVAAPAWAATYAIDPDHSVVAFKIRHLFSKTAGTFNQFEGTVDYEPDKPEEWRAEAVIQAASIDTRNGKRDDHLRTADFFDAETYPTIAFKSTKVTDVVEKGAKLHGLLNLHGTERPVVMNLEILGRGQDPWGKMRVGFTATTTIDRKEFGIRWNKPMVGGLMLGDEVEIVIEVEGVAE